MRTPFGVFSDGSTAAGRAAPVAARQMGKLEARAMQELDLEQGADSAAIRAKYLDLVKRFHPDTNGGDRSTEVKLQRVIKAYKTLQKAKLTT